MLTVTENAAKKIAQLKTEDGASSDAVLRVRVKRGGCSGFSYKMEFDNSTNEKDKVYESSGAKIVIDNQSLLYVMGMVLDYEGGLNGKGFIFQNPNATKTCGCGSSFAV